jgi:hypothetical protein
MHFESVLRIGNITLEVLEWETKPLFLLMLLRNHINKT